MPRPVLAFFSAALLVGVSVGCARNDRSADAALRQTSPVAAELPTLRPERSPGLSYRVAVEGREPERRLPFSIEFPAIEPTPEEQALLTANEPRPIDWLEFYDPDVRRPMVSHERAGANPGYVPPRVGARINAVRPVVRRNRTEVIWAYGKPYQGARRNPVRPAVGVGSATIIWTYNDPHDAVAPPQAIDW